jgi:hypothetical protein
VKEEKREVRKVEEGKRRKEKKIEERGNEIER